MKKINLKKGFTLVELLAVIAILSVIMLIGGQSVFGALDNAQKGAFKTESGLAIQAANSAYQIDILNRNVDTSDTVCYSISWLKNNGYYNKQGNDADSYIGSVLVKPDSSGKNVTYTIWMQNNKFKVSNGNLSNLVTDGAEGADGVVSAITGSDVTIDCNNTPGQTLKK